MTPPRVSLRQAHELLNREWPGRNAPTSAWVAYHRRAADLYAQVAQLDPDHHHEAVYWAGYERDQVQALIQPAEASHQQPKGGSDGSH